MTGSRDALVIATGTYDDPELRRLRAPAQDAEALAGVLRDPAIGAFSAKTVVDQPERVVRRAAQEFFADRSLDDLLLLHLSCHGVKDDDGRLYFAASDTEKQWLASTAVSASFMNDLMERCRARSIVLLLDCCYSGAFLPGSKGDEGVHLKDKFEGEGRAILTASNAIEYAWEGDNLSGSGSPSLFTAAIVEGLETGEADRDRDGVVSIEDLYKHVYEQVRTSGRGQTPKLWALGIQHDLYVARNPRPIKVEPVALPSELRAAVESPLPGVRAGIIEDLARMLRSEDAAVALAAQRALEQLRDDDSRRVSAAAHNVLEDGLSGQRSAEPEKTEPEKERPAFRRPSTAPRATERGAAPTLEMSDLRTDMLGDSRSRSDRVGIEPSASWPSSTSLVVLGGVFIALGLILLIIGVGIPEVGFYGIGDLEWMALVGAVVAPLGLVTALFGLRRRQRDKARTNALPASGPSPTVPFLMRLSLVFVGLGITLVFLGTIDVSGWGRPLPLVGYAVGLLGLVILPFGFWRRRRAIMRSRQPGART